MDESPPAPPGTDAAPGAPPAGAPAGAPDGGDGSGAAAPGAAPPPRRRRRWPFVLGGALALAATAILSLPALLSSRWARARLEADASEATGRLVRLEDLAVGWTGVVLRGLRVGGGPSEADGPFLGADEVRAEVRTGAALSGRYEIPSLLVLRPRVVLDLRERPPRPADPAKAAAKGGASPAGGAAAAREPLPEFSVAVELRDGSLAVVDPDGIVREIGTFSLEAAASRDGPGSANLRLRMGGGGEFALRLALPPAAALASSGSSLPDGVKATVEWTGATLEGVAALLGPRLVPFDRVGGAASARLEAATTGGIVDVSALRVEGRDLVAVGGVLGSVGGAPRSLAEAAVQLDGAFRLDPAAPGAFGVRGLRFQARGIDLRADLDRAPTGGWTGTLDAQAGLDAWSGRALAWTGADRARTPSAVGTMALEARLHADAEAQRATGTLRFEDVSVRDPVSGKIASEAGSRGSFDLVLAGGKLTVHQADLRATAFRADASGTVDGDLAGDLKVTALADLALASAWAAALGRPVPGRIAGGARVEARVVGRPGGGGLEATAELVDLEVTPPGEPVRTVKEPRVVLGARVTAGKERLVVESLSLEAAAARVDARGETARDFSSGTLETEARADLGPLADLLRGLGIEGPVAPSGTAAWKGPLGWERGFARVSAVGTLEGEGVEVVLPAAGDRPERRLREERLRVEVRAVVADGGVDAERVRILADGVDLAVKGSARGGAFEADATGALVLAAAGRRAAALGLLPSDPGAPGRLLLDCGARGGGGRPFSVTVRSLRTEEAPVAVAARGTLDEAGASDLEGTVDGDLPALLDLLARAGVADPPAGGAGTAAAISLRVRAAATDGKAPLLVRATASADGLRWPTASGPAWTQRRLETVADLAVDRASGGVSGSVDLKGDDGTLSLRGGAAKADGGRTLDATFHADLDLGGLCRANPALVPLAGVVPGRLRGTGSVKGPLRSPPDAAALSGTARLEMDRLQAEHFLATEIVADALLRDGAASTRTLRAAVNGGTVEGRAVLGLAGREPRHLLEIRGKGVRVDAPLAGLLARIAPVFALGEAGVVSGTADVEVRLEGRGADWEAVKPNLAGTGVLQVTDGGVAGAGLVGEVLEVLSGTRDLSFSGVRTEFAVRDGRVWNERLTVDGKEHAMVLKGSTSFDGALDYDLSARAIKMGKKKRERFAGVLDADGNLPFGLGGSLSRPKLKPPDLKKVLGGALEDLLKRKAGGLFGGGDD